MTGFAMIQGQCPLCGAQEQGVERVSRYGLGSYFVECKKCSLVYQNPAVPPVASLAYFERLWADKNAGYSRTSDQVGMAEGYIQMLQEICPTRQPPLSVCDFGCGIGTFVAAARKHGYDADGIEYSQVAQGRAKEEFGLILLPKLTDRKYDVFCLWACLEHWQRPQDLLLIAKSHLKQHGKLVLMTPEYVGNFEKCIWYLYDHVSLLSLEALNRMLEETGFNPFHLISRKSNCLWGWTDVE